MPVSRLAADHMPAALCAIYAGSTAPNLTWFPSGGVMLNTGESDPFGNFAAGATVEEFAEAARILASQPVPAMMLVPADRDPKLEAVIEPFGFAHHGAIPGMVVELDQVPTVQVPDGYQVGRVSSDESGEAWAQVLSEAYPVALLAAQSMSPMHAARNDAEDAPIQFFQATFDGQPVAVSALANIDGIAGVYCVATLESHRRKGLGAALTAAPLHAARAMGCKVGVLQASQAGYPTYRKLGFEDESQVHLYLRIPGDVAHNS